DQVGADLVDLREIRGGRRMAGPEPLEVVVEVRKVDERERRVESLVCQLGRGGDPLGRSYGRTRSPELEKRKRAELRLKRNAQVRRRRVDVWELASIGPVDRPR